MRRLSTTDGGRPSSGFTLIEVLVAVGTALMLLTAVYAAIDMHWRYENAGQLEMKRGQVAREDGLFGFVCFLQHIDENACVFTIHRFYCKNTTFC